MAVAASAIEYMLHDIQQHEQQQSNQNSILIWFVSITCWLVVCHSIIACCTYLERLLHQRACIMIPYTPVYETHTDDDDDEDDEESEDTVAEDMQQDEQQQKQNEQTNNITNTEPSGAQETHVCDANTTPDDKVDS